MGPMTGAPAWYWRVNDDGTAEIAATDGTQTPDGRSWSGPFASDDDAWDDMRPVYMGEADQP